MPEEPIVDPEPIEPIEPTKPEEPIEPKPDVKPKPISDKFLAVDKIDENTIEIVKEVPAVENKTYYDYDFLVKQKAAIEADLERYRVARQVEIDEVVALLAECDNLGVKGKE